MEFLEKVLVLSMSKSFWISEESKIFPNILYSDDKRFRSYMWLMVQSIVFVKKHKPKVIILGSDLRVKQGYALLRYFGLFKDINFISINKNSIPYCMIKNWRKILFFSNNEVTEAQKKLKPYNTPPDQCEFVFLPADGKFDFKKSESNEEYIYCAGGNRRDFASVIKAVKKLKINLKIRTFSEKTLDYDGEIPSNCQINIGSISLQDFLREANNAKLVLVSLEESWKPHGHTTIAQAKRLGKAVISTKRSSVDDYISDGIDGYLVEPGDARAYENCINLLINDDELRKKIEKAALESSQSYSYAHYQQYLVELCRKLIVKEC
jgi:glycosyltransferase involved in cell wall biosynthesis